MEKLSHQLAEITSKVIRDRRLSLMLSQDAISQRTGLARSYISDVERGSRHPTLHNLTLLADALEWNPSELIKETEIQVLQLLDPARLRDDDGQLTVLEQEIVRYTNNRMSQGVIIANTLGQFVLYNPTATNVLGIGYNESTPDEWSDLYGCFFLDRITPYPNQELPLVKTLTGSPTNTEKMFLRNKYRPDGTVIEVNSRPIVDPQTGAMKGALCIISPMK